MEVKNIWKIILILIVLHFQSITFAQEIKSKKWIVKWNSTAAIDGSSFPTVQFAVERKLGSNFGIQTEAGIQVYNFNRKNADTLSVNTSGFRLMTEGRFYLFSYFKNDKAKRRKSDGVYTGIQIFYRKNSYNERNYYYLNKSNYDNYTNKITDDYGIKKEVYGINLCLGYQIPINNFVLEPYVYIGGLKRNIKNFDRSYDENLGHVEKDNIHGFISFNDQKEMSGKAENFAFGFRVGYKF
jgi:hypothetical protein